MKLAKFIFTSFLGLFAMQSAFAADCPMGVAITASTICTVPAGVAQVRIEAWGGGGGGGQKNEETETAGGGGGGGAYCAASFPVSPGNSLTVNIGLGGMADTAGGNTSVSGSGVSGLVANGGGPGSTVYTNVNGPWEDYSVGGPGGSIDSCTATSPTPFAGGNGAIGSGSGSDNPRNGGGGGSAATPSGNGNAGNGRNPGSGNNGYGADFSGTFSPSTQGSMGGGGGGGIRGGAPSVGGPGQVILTAIAAPTAIPTLSEWALICLSGLLGLFAAGIIRRRL